MSLTDQQRSFYENTLTVTRQEISDLDAAIADVLARLATRGSRNSTS